MRIATITHKGVIRDLINKTNPRNKMPATAQATHKGITVTFEEEAHIYYTEEMSNFISSSSLYKPFYEPFDPDGSILRRSAAKRNITPEALAAEWKDKADTACRFGTRTHENCEYHLTGRFSEMHQPETTKEYNTFVQAHAAVEVLKANYQLLQAEMILFSERFRIAGTIDIVMYCPATQTVMILDWKTNKKITSDGYNGKTMLTPFEYLPDCHLSHYALQLSTYEFMMRHEGYFPPETKYRRALIHVQEDTWTWHELPDMQNEVALMMLYNRTDHWELEKLPLNFP